MSASVSRQPFVRNRFLKEEVVETPEMFGQNGNLENFCQNGNLEDFGFLENVIVDMDVQESDDLFE